MGQGFDALRQTLIGDSAQLILLREDGVSAPFATSATITSGWFAEFSEEFEATVFNVADITESFSTLMSKREATHLVVTGSDLPHLNNLIHETQAETAAPDGSNPYWRIVAKSVGRKYVSSEEI